MYVLPPFLTSPYQTWHHSAPLLPTESRERETLTSLVRVALSYCSESWTPFSSGRSGGGPLSMWAYYHLVPFTTMSRDADFHQRITNGDISCASSLWYLLPELHLSANSEQNRTSTMDWRNFAARECRPRLSIKLPRFFYFA